LRKSYEFLRNVTLEERARRRRKLSDCNIHYTEERQRRGINCAGKRVEGTKGY
jgi:hypothetical protein